MFYIANFYTIASNMLHLWLVSSICSRIRHNISCLMTTVAGFIFYELDSLSGTWILLDSILLDPDSHLGVETGFWHWIQILISALKVDSGTGSRFISRRHRDSCVLFPTPAGGVPVRRAAGSPPDQIFGVLENFI